MSETTQRNEFIDFQLKECYDLASQYEDFDTAKDLLRGKSKRLNIPNGYMPIQMDTARPETEMQTISDTIYQLSLESPSIYGASDFKDAHRINAMNDSSEKEFVLALLSLRNGTYESQRINALQHIRAALCFSPNDPRYIAMARILQEVDA